MVIDLYDGGKMKVLFVDDNELIRKLFAAMFERISVDFVIAGSAAEALKLFETDKSISMIITDINMPEMDGVQLAKKLKLKNPLIPLFANTGSLDEYKRGDIKEFFDQVFIKPQDTHNILETVKNHIVSETQEEQLTSDEKFIEN